MSTKIRKQLIEFHTAADMPILDKPQIPSLDRVRLRLKLVAEEFCELVDACDMGDSGTRDAMQQAIKVVLSERHAMSKPRIDLCETADALGDLDYVVEGMRLEFGINGEPIADEIHRSNMAKFGPGSRKREDGKVLKPEDWSPPKIKEKLVEQGWKE